MTNKHKRNLFKDKGKVYSHWKIRHNGRNHDKLFELADYELYNYAWIAALNAFIEEGNISDDKRVLDIGFGWGRIIVGLKEKFPNLDIYGLELDDRAVENAQIIFEKYIGDYLKINLSTGDAEDLPFEDNTFNTVISTRVFQYLNDPRKALEHIYRTLVPGGKTVIMVPNKWNPILFFTYHTQVISASRIKSWFEETGFKKIRSGTIVYWYDKFYCFTSDSSWVKFERILTKIPLINKIGGNVWVSGEK